MSCRAPHIHVTPTSGMAHMCLVRPKFGQRALRASALSALPRMHLNALCVAATRRRNNGFINMLRTMKGKALALGGESAIRAAVEQAAPAAETPAPEEAEQSGTMASRITEK